MARGRAWGVALGEEARRQLEADGWHTRVCELHECLPVGTLPRQWGVGAALGLFGIKRASQ